MSEYDEVIQRVIDSIQNEHDQLVSWMENTERYRIVPECVQFAVMRRIVELREMGAK